METNEAIAMLKPQTGDLLVLRYQCVAERQQLEHAAVEACRMLADSGVFVSWLSLPHDAIIPMFVKPGSTVEEAVAAEREACAVEAEAQGFYPDTSVGMWQQWIKDQIAAAIRARGK